MSYARDVDFKFSISDMLIAILDLALKLYILWNFYRVFFFLRMIVLCANCAMDFSNFAINTYVYKELMFLDSGILLLLHITSCIFISIYRRHTRAPCLRTSIRTKYFAKLSLKCTDGFLCVWKKEEELLLRERRSHPVGYRRGRWATNNSMCAYKLIRLPTTLSPFGVEPR